MTDKPRDDGRRGPELSAALDARNHPTGIEPGFPKTGRREIRQTPPSALGDDADSEHAIPLNPPAKPDGS